MKILLLYVLVLMFIGVIFNCHDCRIFSVPAFYLITPAFLLISNPLLKKPSAGIILILCLLFFTQVYVYIATAFNLKSFLETVWLILVILVSVSFYESFYRFFKLTDMQSSSILLILALSIITNTYFVGTGDGWRILAGSPYRSVIILFGVFIYSLSYSNTPNIYKNIVFGFFVASTHSATFFISYLAFLVVAYRRYAAYYIILIPFVTLISYLFYGDYFWSKVTSIQNLLFLDYEAAKEVGVNVKRSLQWYAALVMISDHPLGVGLGADLFLKNVPGYLIDYAGVLAKPHNMFLYFFASSGIFFGAAIVYVFVRPVVYFKRIQSPELYIFVLFLAFMNQPELNVLFWVLFFYTTRISNLNLSQIKGSL